MTDKSLPPDHLLLLFAPVQCCDALRSGSELIIVRSVGTKDEKPINQSHLLPSFLFGPFASKKNILPLLAASRCINQSQSLESSISWPYSAPRLEDTQTAYHTWPTGPRSYGICVVDIHVEHIEESAKQSPRTATLQMCFQHSLSRFAQSTGTVLED